MLLARRQRTMHAFSGETRRSIRARSPKDLARTPHRDRKSAALKQQPPRLVRLGCDITVATLVGKLRHYCRRLCNLAAVELALQARG